MDWEQLTRSLASIGIGCGQIQEDLKEIATKMALSISEAMSYLYLALAGDIELLNKFTPKEKKIYKRTMAIKPTKSLIRDRRLKIYYCRNKL